MEKQVAKLQALRAKRVWAVRQLTKFSRREFAKRYGIAAGTLQNWEDPTGNGLSEKGAYRLVNALRQDGIYCTSEWLLHGVGDPPQLVDLLPAVAVVMESQGSTDTEQTAITAELHLFCTQYPEAIYLLINDDSMAPHYNAGDYVAGVRYYANDIPKLVGKDCIVLLNTGEQLLRRLRFSHIPGLFDLLAVNPKTTIAKPYLYDVNLVYAAPVIWQRRCCISL